jgi:periplasmic divalent cation tolerance protein
MQMSTEVCIALVTCPPDRAPELAAALVQDRHAACVNIVPAVQSVYRWQGAMQNEAEALLIIKTSTARFEALKKAVLKLHPYELPEVIAVKVEHGHRPYLDWVLDNISQENN